MHLVNQDIDSGPILDQAVVPVHSNDTEATLAKRILEQEHKLYPKAIERFIQRELLKKDKEIS